MPEKIDLLIESRWIAPVDTGAILENHTVAVRGSQIAAILPAHEAIARYPQAERTQLHDHLLIPGLINLHTHAAMSLLRGIADDQPLMKWLQEHIWPAEAAHVSHDFVRDGTLLACAEMIRSGITTFNDMYFFPQASAEAADEIGMRAVLGITVMEFPNAYASDPDDYLHKGLATRDRWIDHPLINFTLAPHAPYTVSNNTFERIATLSEQLGLPIHCHIHETQQEINDSIQQFGCRPLARLQQLGILSPNFIGVHAVHLQENEIELLARYGCSVALCPTSNLKLASGIAPMDKMSQTEINLGFGSDGAASNNRLDILQEMRLASLLTKAASQKADAWPAARVLRMATLDSARALGLEHKIGSITPGKQADLCAIDLSAIEHQPCYSPISHLLHVAERNAVSHVWIAGKPRLHDKKLLNINECNLKNSARLWQNKLESAR